MILEIIRHKGYKCYEGKQSGEGYFRLCFDGWKWEFWIIDAI